MKKISAASVLKNKNVNIYIYIWICKGWKQHLKKNTLAHEFKHSKNPKPIQSLPTSFLTYPCQDSVRSNEKTFPLFLCGKRALTLLRLSYSSALAGLFLYSKIF